MRRIRSTSLYILFVVVFFIMIQSLTHRIMDKFWLMPPVTYVTEDANHCVVYSGDDSLLTLFTSFSPSKQKNATHRLVVKNWSKLAPIVKPILFLTNADDGDGEFANWARSLGWCVHYLKTVTDSGLPRLKDLFLEAQRLSDTPYYGYSNGDILYTDDLIQTLRFLNDLKRTPPIALIVGRRKNYNTSQQLNDFSTLKQVANPLFFFNDNAEDYFITRRGGFNWSDILEFVIGRVGFDNWLVATTLKRNALVMDVSNTVTALHLSDGDGNYAGRHANFAVEYNNLLINNSAFPVGLGHTSCAQLYTLRVKWEVGVRHRRKNKCAVGFSKVGVDPYHYQNVDLLNYDSKKVNND